MSPQSGDAISRLQDTVADARLANAFYRQDQLAKVQKSIIDKKDELLGAMVKDVMVTNREAFAELYSTVSAIKTYLDQISPAKELEVEYSVAHNQDSKSARQAVGVVVIKPQAHTFLFSTISALCAAIASGNPVLLVLEQTLHLLPPVISTLLNETLDPGVVEVVSSEPPEIEGPLIRIDQLGDGGSLNTLNCSQKALTVAIVDRTCTLEDVANSIWMARSSFGGTSPYAPDIILVNEFAKQDFVNALISTCLKNHDVYPSKSNGHFSISRNIKNSLQQASTCISSGAWGQIIEITKRQSLKHIHKVRDRTFYIHTYRSLDDVMETANNLSSEPNLATLSFGDLKTCKFLLQFIDSEVGFANTVPIELLIGPAAPSMYPVVLSTRYSLEMLSVPRPRYVQKTDLSSTLDAILRDGSVPRGQSKKLEALQADKRGPTQQDVGYFERGVFVGAATISLPLFAAAGTAIVLTVRAFIRRYASD